MAEKKDIRQTTYIPPTEEVIEPPQKAKMAPAVSGVNELLKHFSDVSRTLRILEERYINLRRKTQVTDQNMLSINKNITREIKTINSEVDELRRSLEKIKQDVKLIQNDLSICASASDVNVIKKYLNFWEPLNFVTEAQVRDIVRGILNKK